ncbi:MAG TPA: hypothetical protein VGG45_19540 [Terracidiphilus sp.]
MAPLLPPANEFRVTLAEAPDAKLPPAPACGGEAAGTLTCRAFTVTLENIGTHTVRLSGLDCADPEVRLETPAPFPTGWYPVGEHRDDCHGVQSSDSEKVAIPWKNVRMKPGDRYSFTGRFMVQLGGAWKLMNMPETPTDMLRARWTLRGCTEETNGDDCLSPLEMHYVPAHQTYCTYQCIFFQPALEVLSAPISVSAPGPLSLPLPPLELALTAQMFDPSDPLIQPNSRLDGCTPKRAGSVDCVALHMTVRNAGTRALRVGRMNCSDFAEAPEFRTEDGVWKPLHSSWWMCTRNFMEWTALLPGQTIEEETTLRHVAAGFQINPVREAGRYDVRMIYTPEVCVASPDGSFCLTEPQCLPQMTSPAATFETSVTLPEENLQKYAPHDFLTQ